MSGQGEGLLRKPVDAVPALAGGAAPVTAAGRVPAGRPGGPFGRGRGSALCGRLLLDPISRHRALSHEPGRRQGL